MNKPLRVCMLGSSFNVRGGMTSVCRQLTSHHYGHGIEIEYIPTHEFGPILHRCGMFLRGYWKLFRMLCAHKVDLVHMHMSERGSFFRKYMIFCMVKHFHKPCVVHMHGAEFQVFYENASPALQKRIRRMLREVDKLVVLGKHWDEIVRNIEPAAKTLVINNAVAIPPVTAKWDEAETHLCYLGVLIPRKGVSDLLDALRLLLDHPDLPRPIRLTIAGSGEEAEALAKKCQDLGLSNYVTFTGWTAGPEKQSQLLSSQCFILPSYNEGLPVAILEALSCGLPVVTTDVGSINEAIEDSVNGYFVPVHEPHALADAIARTIQSREHWEKLSAGARKTAEDRFDENLLFESMEKLYLSLVREDSHE